jgi:hypothetical protein
MQRSIGTMNPGIAGGVPLGAEENAAAAVFLCASAVRCCSACVRSYHPCTRAQELAGQLQASQQQMYSSTLRGMLSTWSASMIKRAGLGTELQGTLWH